MGVFVGGADLEVVDEKEAQEAIKSLDMAKEGLCNKAYPDD
jgi:hydrogenase maturation factor